MVYIDFIVFGFLTLCTFWELEGLKYLFTQNKAKFGSFYVKPTGVGGSKNFFCILF